MNILRKWARPISGPGIRVVSSVTKLNGLKTMRAALLWHGAPSRQCMPLFCANDSCPLDIVGWSTHWYSCLSPPCLLVSVVMLVRRSDLVIPLTLLLNGLLSAGRARKANIPCFVRELIVTWQATERFSRGATGLLLIVLEVRQSPLILCLSRFRCLRQ